MIKISIVSTLLLLACEVNVQDKSGVCGGTGDGGRGGTEAFVFVICHV